MRSVKRLLAVCALSGMAMTVAIVVLRKPPLAAGMERPVIPTGTLERGAARGGPRVVINELAWMGTEASPFDEWIELHNVTSATISLEGWRLVDDDHLNAVLGGQIPAQGYYLLERKDDKAVIDIAADWSDSFGQGGLANTGEVLTLTDDLGNVVDTANREGGGWPAGVASEGSPRYASMERVDPALPDTEDNWCTNDGVTRNGTDAAGGPINGTPKAPNSCYRTGGPTVPNLEVGKHAPSFVHPGDPITYHIILSNTGTGTATETVLTDTFPAGIRLVTATTPYTAIPTDPSLVWRPGEIPPGAGRTITAVAHVSRTTVPGTCLVNVVTLTAVTTETVVHDNVASCTTTVEAASTIYFPSLFHDYVPPPYGVIIEAALYDGLQTADYDETVLLLNGRDRTVDLTGWELCKRGAERWSCTGLPSTEIGPQERRWFARSGAYFAKSFGFTLPEKQVLPGWPRLNNAGDELALRDADGRLQDAFVYKGGLTDIEGWSGPAVQPYRGPGFAEEGQVLYRRLDEGTGLPAADTDTAADWAQCAADPGQGRRVRYPGWDFERFFQPALDVTGRLTVGIAPDNAYRLVRDTVRSAKERIEIEAYSLEHYGLVRELVDRARQGVSVTVLLEGGPVGGVEDQELWACQQLHATGRGACYFMVQSEMPKIYPRYRYLHAKVMIVDRQRLLLGSQNLVWSSLPGDHKGNGTGGSRGVVLVTDAPQIVARALEVFEADCDPDRHDDVSLWGPDNALGYGPPPPGFIPDRGGDWMTYTVQFPNLLEAEGADFELLTAPEAALRQSDGLLGLVARARAGDAIYAEQLYERADWGDPLSAPNLRLQAYLDAARRGARVRLLLNGGTFDAEAMSLVENIEAAAYVNETARAEGLDASARLGDPTDYGIHSKMVLVDLGAKGKYAHVGSLNGSETSSKVNREMALQVRSALLFDYLRAVFQHDWNHQPAQDHVLISEVMADPDGTDAGREWVELYNPTGANVDLSGWHVGDVGTDGEYGSGLYRFPSGATLVAEGVIVLAHQAEDVTFTPDYEFLIDPLRDDPSVPNLVAAGSWEGFGLALGNDGDEVLLLDARQTPVDVVAYGDGDYPDVVPHPGVTESGHSLERRPPRQDTDDCGVDFFDRYPPTPGTLPE